MTTTGLELVPRQKTQQGLHQRLQVLETGEQLGLAENMQGVKSEADRPSWAAGRHRGSKNNRNWATVLTAGR